MIFIPSKSDYIRTEQGKDFAFSDTDRLQMLNKIAEKNPWMEVSDCELKLSHQPRTYDTLCSLRTDGLKLKLLLGSDKLTELQHGWLHIPEICREFGIAVMIRGRDPAEQMIDRDPFLSSLKQYFTIIHTPDTWQNVSSTAVRRAFSESRLDTVAEMIPDELNLEDYRRRA